MVLELVHSLKWILIHIAKLFISAGSLQRAAGHIAVIAAADIVDAVVVE